MIRPETAADIRVPAATIVEKIPHKRAETGVVDAVTLKTPVALRPNEAGLFQRRKVKRQARCRDPELACNPPGAQPIRPGTDKQPKNVEPRFIGKRRQGGEG